MADIQAILDKIECLNTEEITKMKKRRYKGKYVYVVVELPNKEIAKRMITKFLTAVDETGYNASFIDIKKESVHGHEHFIYVRIGAHNYYLSEYGLDKVIESMKNNDIMSTVQHVASHYGMRRTASRRNIMQSAIYAEMETDDDEKNEELINKLTEMSYSELCDEYEKIPVKKDHRYDVEFDEHL